MGRFLWASNYTSHSGYSNQARMFVPRIARDGHTVAVVNITGGSNMPQMVGGVEVLPTWGDALGRDGAILSHYQKQRTHALITMVDVWAFIGSGMDKLNWFPFVPVDHMPAPPQVLAAVKECKRPIAMSQFGKLMLENAGYDPLYIPLMYDPSIWKPGDMSMARQQLNWRDDLFCVSFAGVNDSLPSRKGIPELLIAWRIFSEMHNDVQLYLHTSTQRQTTGVHGGIDAPAFIQSLGINPKTIVWVQQEQYRTHIPQSHLVAVAQASDVLCAPSRGEGFGLLPLEFQACGCPVITTHFSAQTEMNFDGWFVEYEPELSWQESLWAKPGIQGIVDALEAAYLDKGNKQRRANVAQRSQAYSAEIVYNNYMRPALNMITEYVLEMA